MTYWSLWFFLMLVAVPAWGQSRASGNPDAPAPPVSPAVPPSGTGGFTPAPVPSVAPPELSPAARAGGTNSEYNTASPIDSTPFSGPPAEPSTQLNGNPSIRQEYGAQSNGNAPVLPPGTPNLSK